MLSGFAEAYLHIVKFECRQHNTSDASYRPRVQIHPFFLCPRYFTNPISPVGSAGKNCLKVGNNVIVRDGKQGQLILAQNYILLHELMHSIWGKHLVVV